MKNIYIFLLSLILLAGIGNQANAQSLSVSGSTFLPQDSISFTYSSPSFSSTDWIGIYKSDVTPMEGGAGSIEWKHIKGQTGTLNLKAPKNAGKYIAYLLCCDAYTIIATSAEFSVEIPSLGTSFPSYVQGDSIVFNYLSPKFSSTDKIAVYTEGTKPGISNPAIDWKYITSLKGSLTFKTALNAGYYDAYLLCCDGLDSISACSFQIIDQATAFLNPSTQNYETGATININYNDPAFVDGDWIGIYKDGVLPVNGQQITWSKIVSKSGIITFPAVLSGGYYYAALFSKDNVAYASSVVFNIPVETGGSYVKTSASVYPEGNTILVNYKDVGYTSTDWIGIYKKDQIPGGPEALEWHYAAKDSSTVEFTKPLALGDYVVYLLCCDGYDVKAKYDFKVVGLNTASLILPAMSFEVGDALEFIYNDPNFASGGGTDWIGIYNQGDIPSDVRSIVWDYLKDSNNSMIFSVPYPNGTLPEADPTIALPPGEYYAGLFCCDSYGLYASVSFTVKEIGTGVKQELKSESSLSLFPNPTSGLINIKIAVGDKMKKIMVYSLTGQILFEEIPTGTVNQKTLDLKHLGKGIYFIEAQTEKYKVSKKLIIQ